MTTHRKVVLNNHPVEPRDLAIWADVRFDSNDAAPDYIGLNTAKGAATTSTDWKIYKFTYAAGTSNATQIQLAYGSWDNRASLF